MLQTRTCYSDVIGPLSPENCLTKKNYIFKLPLCHVEVVLRVGAGAEGKK